MASTTNLDNENRKVKRTALSLDAWAVTLALALALLIWSGVIKHIPW
jgi:hypothetical protein